MKSQNKCSDCGRVGHNMRTCGGAKKGSKVPLGMQEFQVRGVETPTRIKPDTAQLSGGGEPSEVKADIGAATIRSAFSAVRDLQLGKNANAGERGGETYGGVERHDSLHGNCDEVYSAEDVQTLWDLKNGNYGYANDGMVHWDEKDSEDLHKLLILFEHTGSNSVTVPHWRAFFHTFHPAVLYMITRSYWGSEEKMPTKYYYAVHDSLIQRAKDYKVRQVYHSTVQIMCEMRDPPEDFIMKKILPNAVEVSRENSKKVKTLTDKNHISGEMLEKIHHITNNALRQINEMHETPGGSTQLHSSVEANYYETLANIIKHPNITTDLADEYCMAAENPHLSPLASTAFYASVLSNPSLPTSFVEKKFTTVYAELKETFLEHKNNQSHTSMRTPDVLKNATIADKLVRNPNLPSKYVIEYLNPDANFSPLGMSASKNIMYGEANMPTETCAAYAVKLLQKQQWSSLSSILHNPNLNPTVQRDVLKSLEQQTKTNKYIASDPAVKGILETFKG